MQYQLTETSICSSDFDSLLNTIDSNSDYWRLNTSDKEKKRRGQHFTPLSMAVQLSVMSQPKLMSNVSIADPGAGTGILSTALACKLKSEKIAETISFLGFETDSRLHDDLLSAWSFFTAQSGVENDINLNEDFTAVAAQLLATGEIEGLQKPSYITTNPPYNKLLSTSPLAKMLKDFGVPVSNLYAAFVILATEWLEDDGQLLAVLPRSFCSGIYFKKFRKYLMEKLSIEHITLYKSRSCFKNVLQENILICEDDCNIYDLDNFKKKVNLLNNQNFDCAIFGPTDILNIISKDKSCIEKNFEESNNIINKYTLPEILVEDFIYEKKNYYGNQSIVWSPKGIQKIKLYLEEKIEQQLDFFISFLSQNNKINMILEKNKTTSQFLHKSTLDNDTECKLCDYDATKNKFNKTAFVSIRYYFLTLVLVIIILVLCSYYYLR